MKSRRSNRRLLLFGGGATLFLVAIVALIVWFATSSGGAEYITFEVRRGPLDVKVLEGGNVEALEAQEVKSEVEGWEGTKILSIVEEGRYITKEDVENGLVLVELDSSELRDKLTTAEISFKGTQASLADAEQGYEIQLSKSETDIYAAEIEVKFAKLEMEKYLGGDVTKLILDEIARIDLEEAEAEQRAEAAERKAAEAAAAEADPKNITGGDGDVSEGQDISKSLVEEQVKKDGGPSAAEEPPAVTGESPLTVEVELEAIRLEHPKIDFTQYADAEKLGDGEANQELNKRIDETLVAARELALAESQLEGKQRLRERDFVTARELERAEMDVQKQQIAVETAQTAERLFMQYEFPKEAEKRMSDYIQAVRKLERTERQAISELAKARAQLLSSQARFNIEQRRIREYQEQISKCVMRAEREGLVVYGGGDRWWNDEPIKEGATVRQRQTIVTIPDMTTMAVKVKIHESEIKKIKEGQRARIRVDAHHDILLDGKVTKVAVLPDSENRWMNPDLKVYETTISIDGLHEWLKPGMSAETEIFIDRLEKAFYVPIQSVVPQGTEQVCYVLKGGEPERRVVQTGAVTVEYIVIESGLEEGEKVLLLPPKGSRQDQADASADRNAEEMVEEVDPGEPAEDGADSAPVSDAQSDALEDSEAAETETAAAAEPGDAESQPENEAPAPAP